MPEGRVLVSGSKKYRTCPGMIARIPFSCLAKSDSMFDFAENTQTKLQ